MTTHKSMSDAPVLVTGAAGFIGYHTSLRLLADGHEVVGFDNLNPYYDVTLKEARLARLEAHSGFRLVRGSLEDREAVEALFAEVRLGGVVHLAAQAGVRHSLTHPHSYVASNLTGFLHILEGCRHHGVGHLVYASTSSVYGANTAMPFAESASVDHPLTLYAASKKANELMAHSYAHLYGVPMTGLRFFSVYGPWGRPDMAAFLFVRAILEGQAIDVYNHGDMARDFTYVDDIVEGVVRVLARPAAGDAEWRADAPNPGTSAAPWRIYNIGNSAPVDLMEFIGAIEDALGMKAHKNFLPMQLGDVPRSWANVDDLAHDVGYRPATPVREGVQRFVEWYREYYRV